MLGADGFEYTAITTPGQSHVAIELQGVAIDNLYHGVVSKGSSMPLALDAYLSRFHAPIGSPVVQRMPSSAFFDDGMFNAARFEEFYSTGTLT